MQKKQNEVISTLARSLEIAEQSRTDSNLAELTLFRHLFALEDQETWKQKAYYKGMEDYIHLQKYTFPDFLKEAFSWTYRRYSNMLNIICGELKKGKEGERLFLRYGRANMVCYLKRTKAERRKILVEAEKAAQTVAFNHIYRKLYPLKAKTKDEGEIASYVAEIKDLKKELKKKDKKINQLNKDLAAAELTIKQMRDIFK